MGWISFVTVAGIIGVRDEGYGCIFGARGGGGGKQTTSKIELGGGGGARLFVS